MKNLFSILSISACILFFSSCEDCIDGSGTAVSETVAYDSFTGIDLQSSINVYLKKGDTQEVRFEAPSNVIDALVDETNVAGGILEIDMKEGCYKNLDAKVYITLPSFSEINASGSGDITSESRLLVDEKFELIVSGSGDVEIDFEGADEVKANLSGSGNIEIDSGSARFDLLDLTISGSGDFESLGSVEDQKIDASGSGDVNNGNLESEDCNIDLSGSGDVTVDVYDVLTAEISGSGDVCYTGNPSVFSETPGSGDLENCN